MEEDVKGRQAYDLLAEEDLGWFDSVGRWFRHRESGCEIYHIANRDRENTFVFSFSTPPTDNTGVAHIIEHAVLCGSKRFPVRDPFLSLLKGSAYTSMNACTYADKTLYHASSVLEKDFFNLLTVYGDAVFSPLLQRETFLQEGCRLEYDSLGKLRRSGVVYNEMQGDHGAEENFVAEWAVRALFPGTSYEYDSGGEPEAIAQLTYQEFRARYAQWYHPANCRLVLCGDIPHEKALAFLDERVLPSRTGSKDPILPPPLQKRWESPRIETKVFPALTEPPKGKGATVLLSWLAPLYSDREESYAFYLLSDILLGNPGSPLYAALQRAGIGEDLSPVSGVTTHMRELAFTVGMRGMASQQSARFLELTMETLAQLTREGISSRTLQGTLNEEEFRQREAVTASSLGMRLAGRILRGWHYGVPPGESLADWRYFEKARKKDSSYFEELIDQYLLKNPHRILMTIQADAQKGQKKRQAIEREMVALEKNLSPEEKSIIKEEGARSAQLIEEQGEPLGVIPTLDRGDIPHKIVTIPRDIAKEEGATYLFHPIETHGIAHIAIAIPLKDVDPSYHRWLPLYSQALGDMGFPGVSYTEVAEEQALKLGGFGSHLSVATPIPTNGEKALGYFIIRVKVLEMRWQEGMDLVRRILLLTDFTDQERIEHLWQEAHNSLQASFIPEASYHAMLRVGARFSRAGSLKEGWYGLTQLQHLRALKNLAKKEAAIQVGKILISLHEEVLSASRRAILSLVGSSRTRSLATAWWRGFIQDLPSKPHNRPLEAPPPSLFQHPTTAESLRIGTPVGYTAAALPAPSYPSAAYAHTLLLLHVLGTGYLWEMIRMKGGGYGGSATLSGLDGFLSFFSYRDPQVIDTLRAYQESLRRASEAVTSEDVRLAVIGCGSKELRPLSPNQQGMLSLHRYLCDITDQDRQEQRQHLLAAKKSDLVSTANNLTKAWQDKVAITVLAGDAILKKAGDAYPDLVTHGVKIAL